MFDCEASLVQFQTLRNAPDDLAVSLLHQMDWWKYWLRTQLPYIHRGIAATSVARKSHEPSTDMM